MSCTKENKRQGQFKSRGAANDLAETNRRRREDNGIQLRKNKREEGLAKRRNLVQVNNFTTPEEETESASAGAAASTPASKKYTVDDIPALTAGLQAGDLKLVAESLKGFRRLLSIEPSPPVVEVLNAGVLPMFAAFLQRDDHPELQFEAAWALTNVASTDKTRAVVDIGIVPSLVKLLVSANVDVREQCAWCLGNIAGDCTDLRDHVLAAGAMGPLLQNIVQPENATILRNATWTLSNFCRGKPHVALDHLKAAAPTLVALLASDDPEVLMDACWALSYLTDGPDERIQPIVDAGVCRAIVRLLGHSSIKVITPVLRTLGNVVTGNDAQTQSAIDSGAIGAMHTLLQHPKKAIRKETCWLLSNIAAGSPAQISSLMSLPELIPSVIAQLDSGDWDVRKEATWVVSNIALGGTRQHVRQLVEYRPIKPLCDVLTVHDSKIVKVALETLEAILKIDDIPGTVLIDEADGLDKIEALQQHENDEIYQQAVRIIETYFGEDEGEDENVVPNVAAGDSKFAFGLGAPALGAPATGFSF